MKSTVKFDLNDHNQPIIKAILEDSDDLRDKVAKRFGETLQYDSLFAWCFYEQGAVDSHKKQLIISPVAPTLEELEGLRDSVEHAIKRIKEQK